MKHLIIMLAAHLLATAPALQAQAQVTEKPVEIYNPPVKIESNKTLTQGKLNKSVRCVKFLLTDSKTGLIMGEVGVAEKPAEKQKAKVERLAKYENPKTITEHFVNNVLDAAEKVQGSKDLSVREIGQLRNLLRDLAEDEKENTKDSLFKAVFDKAQMYLDGGVKAEKMKIFLDGTAKKFAVAYNKSSNPVDRTQFTAILQASVAQAVDSYMVPEKVVEANLKKQEPVKNASVPATQIEPTQKQATVVEK